LIVVFQLIPLLQSGQRRKALKSWKERSENEKEDLSFLSMMANIPHCLSADRRSLKSSLQSSLVAR